MKDNIPHLHVVKKFRLNKSNLCPKKLCCPKHKVGPKLGDNLVNEVDVLMRSYVLEIEQQSEINGLKPFKI